MAATDEVWVVDDDQSIRWVLEKALQKAELAARVFESGEALLSALKQYLPSVIVTDVRMPGISGLELLQGLQSDYPDIPVVIMTAHSDLDSAVSAYEGGAFDYLPKPFDIKEAIDVIERARQMVTSSSAEPVTSEDKTTEIIGEAPAMQEVFRAVGRLTRSNVTVLINGESGTGKELVAKALHRHSARRDRPFIALNMAAIPKDLMESELFGHEKGAFTGASGSRKGRFEQADGGTLFLDEIGDMPADMQTRLLRVLADGEFYRVGGHVPVKSDVRIIAATHQDLNQRVADGRFREDLFHRLNVIRIRLPALRERQEDIPLLARHFLKLVAEELSVEPKLLTNEAEEYLKALPWPGNVRELENTCRWLSVMCSSREVYIRDLPPEIQGVDQQQEGVSSTTDWQGALKRWLEQTWHSGDHEPIQHVVEEVERVLIETTLGFTHGRKQDAAAILGWGRNTLTRKIQAMKSEIL
jgi:two-component system nitrogen regulation response regulator GlnG